MEHPDVTEIRRYGYPKYPSDIDRVDSLGNTLYKGDEVYEMDDEVYVIEELTSDARTILERHGAVRRTI